MPRKTDKRSRRRGGGKFVALPEFMLATDAYRATSPAARAALIEILRAYNGSNNGRLAMSASIAAQRIGCSRATAGRALVELCSHGLIEQMAAGHFTPYSPKATEWRVTWHRCDVSHALPSKAFIGWKPETAKKTKSGLTSLQVRSHLVAGSGQNQASLSHVVAGKGHFEPDPCLTSLHHIDIYHGRGAIVSEGPRPHKARPAADVVPFNSPRSEQAEPFAGIDRPIAAILDRLQAHGSA